jgi:hypothetical protein
MKHKYSIGLRKIRHLLYTGADIEQGLFELIDHCRFWAPSTVWDKIGDLPFKSDINHLYKWITKSILNVPLTEPIQVFWVGLLNPILDDQELYLLSSKFYEPYSVHCDWAFSYFGSHFPRASYSDSIVLRSISNKLYGSSKFLIGMSVLGLGYVCLAIRDIFHELNPRILLGGMISRAVVVGLDPLSYLDYVFCRLGYIYPQGFHVIY